jgi:hypothetical protein
MKFFIIFFIIFFILCNIPKCYPRIYLIGLTLNSEESYIKAEKFCSKYKFSLDRDFCRSYITERYNNGKK